MFDIKRFCQSHSISFAESGHHHCKQGWVQVQKCPFCGSQKYHLGFSLTTGAVHCWRCGKQSTWEYLKAVLNTNDNGRIRKIQDDFDTNPQQVERKRERRKVCDPPPGMGELGDEHKRYLVKRGFDPDYLIHEWELKATRHLSGLWSWRIIIPIFDIDRQVVAYTGRSIQKAQPQRYKTTEDANCAIDPRNLLYGIHAVRGNSIVVVEGPTGVWRIGPGCIATLGIDWKSQQAVQLKNYERRYLLFDPEPVAQRRAEELADYLSFYPGETEILTGFENDSGSLSKDELSEVQKLLM